MCVPPPFSVFAYTLIFIAVRLARVPCSSVSASSLPGVRFYGFSDTCRLHTAPPARQRVCQPPCHRLGISHVAGNARRGRQPSQGTQGRSKAAWLGLDTVLPVYSGPALPQNNFEKAPGSLSERVERGIELIQPRVKVVQVSGARGRRYRKNAGGWSRLAGRHRYRVIVRRCDEKTTQNHRKLSGWRDKRGGAVWRRHVSLYT